MEKYQAVVFNKDSLWYVLDSDDLMDCNIIGIYRNYIKAIKQAAEYNLKQLELSKGVK